MITEHITREVTLSKMNNLLLITVKLNLNQANIFFFGQKYT